MKCENPVLCWYNGKTKIYRNWSLANPIHRSMHQEVFDCGQCLTCRKKRSQELAMRCVLHASLYQRNCFITLTYDEKKPGYHNRFQYSDIQDFKKRLRRHCDYHYKKKIQVFNVHEYGKNHKKHWHLVVFNHDFNEQLIKEDGIVQDEHIIHSISNGNKLSTALSLSKLWTHGYHTIGDVTEASALYQAQYTQKDFKNGNNENSYRSHSKHSGLARHYFLKHFTQILNLGYIPFGGRKAPIPRYFLKIAHKHFSHFYQVQNFLDLPERKKLYTPFKNPGEANRSMADLYLLHTTRRENEILKRKLEWEEKIKPHIYNNDLTDFQKSGLNKAHDLKRKITTEKF